MMDAAAAIAEDQPIWHYRQFAEFTAILQSQTLWFSRLTCLRDPFEGRSGRQSKFHHGCDEHTRNGCVSCWTIDEEESELMWHAYASGYGVAIRSTKARLKAAIPQPLSEKIMIGVVEYGEDWSKGTPLFYTLPNGYGLRKQRAFKWEQELRAFLPYEYEYDGSARIVEPMYSGKPIPVDLHTLMVELWMSPYAPDWFLAVVEKELEAYGYGKVPVKRRSRDDSWAAALS